MERKRRHYKSMFNDEQLKFIIDNYIEMGGKYCAERLKNFTVKQIVAKANNIGLKIKRDLIGYHARNGEDLSHILSIKTPFISYFLGFLWADGTVSKKTSNIKLKIVNDDFEDIKNEVFLLTKSWRFRIDIDGHPNHKDQAVLELNHWELRNFLVENDYLIKSGASACKILSKIPDHLKHYWWRGYFDGDGGFTAHDKTRRISLSSTYSQNWDFVVELCNKLNIGFRLSKYNEFKHSGSHIIFENEAWVKKFFEYIYQGEIFGLKRKYNAYLEYLKYKLCSYPNKTSKYKGVFKRRGRWEMAIYSKKAYRKSFKNEIDAAREYDKMAKILHGNKAILNFPNE